MKLSTILGYCKKYNFHFSWDFDAWNHEFYIIVNVDKKTFKINVFTKIGYGVGYGFNEEYDGSKYSRIAPYKRIIDYNDIPGDSECLVKYKIIDGREIKTRTSSLKETFRKIDIKSIVDKLPLFKIPKGYGKLTAFLTKFWINSFNSLKAYWKLFAQIQLLKSFIDRKVKIEKKFNLEYAKHNFEIPDYRDKSQKNYQDIWENYNDAVDDLTYLKKFINIPKLYSKLPNINKEWSDDDFANIEMFKDNHLNWTRKFLEGVPEYLQTFEQLVSEVETSLKAEMQLTECEFLKK